MVQTLVTEEPASAEEEEDDGESGSDEGAKANKGVVRAKVRIVLNLSMEFLTHFFFSFLLSK